MQASYRVLLSLLVAPTGYLKVLSEMSRTLLRTSVRRTFALIEFLYNAKQSTCRSSSLTAGGPIGGTYFSKTKDLVRNAAGNKVPVGVLA